MDTPADLPFSPGGERLSAGSYVDLMEQLPEGIVFADAQHRLMLANSRAERLTGLPLRTMVGQDVRTALPLFDAAGSSWWEGNDPWGGLRTRSGSPECRVAVSSGHTVLLATRHIRRSDRTLRFLIMSMRDTRARDRIEADMSALITTVAHELRSPLASVSGFSRTLAGRWSQLRDDQKRWMLDAIETDAQRLSRLVGELLDISRLDTGRLVLHRRPLDLTAAVSERVARIVSAGQDPTRFSVIDDSDGTDLWADPDRVAQIVDNLLQNAVRHGAGKVRAHVHSGRDNIMLDVSDEGPGIPLDERTVVFSRFWQADARRKTGSGLGLYVVRGLVEAHGGHVTVLDEGPGATFRVTLPSDLPKSLR
ncbi:sensor histidine kinase [Leekyejoonella antrihumi]|uniref:histidine kinase n=1 Tax=Leekyejoonella antrihumi TaxID=1660198 RepID=A0A563DT65_9MICO|nr:HAMP domain-containing sensor histidine kinase [Leekyejoonella antrihumi]TWP33349.1 HAMP domain-containing histidine kinase [Leekyejoonella antrihumi]